MRSWCTPNLVDSIWINDFDIDRKAGILRATVYTDCCMHDFGTSVTKLAVYYIVRSQHTYQQPRSETVFLH